MLVRQETKQKNKKQTNINSKTPRGKDNPADLNTKNIKKFHTHCSLIHTHKKKM